MPLPILPPTETLPERDIYTVARLNREATYIFPYLIGFLLWTLLVLRAYFVDGAAGSGPWGPYQGE